MLKLAGKIVEYAFFSGTSEEKTDFRDQLQRAEVEIPEELSTLEVEQVDFRHQLQTEV